MKENELFPENQPKSTKELYINLLRLGTFPESPTGMPFEVFLPVDALGDLETAILQTSEDEYERSQFISWDNSHKNFKHKKLDRAVHTLTLGRPGPLKVNVFKAFFGRKDLIFWHTHPKGLALFSSEDIAVAQALPRLAYIFMVGSNQGISALFQTKESVRLPLTSFDITPPLPDSQWNRVSLLEKIWILDKAGFGFYGWTPSGGRLLQQGDLQNGLTMRRLMLSYA